MAILIKCGVHKCQHKDLLYLFTPGVVGVTKGRMVPIKTCERRNDHTIPSTLHLSSVRVLFDRCCLLCQVHPDHTWIESTKLLYSHMFWSHLLGYLVRCRITDWERSCKVSQPSRIIIILIRGSTGSSRVDLSQPRDITQFTRSYSRSITPSSIFSNGYLERL